MANSERIAVEWVENPCRNFNILGSEIIIDPLDGREKYVLSNFAAGATGNIIIIDVETGQGEAITLPGDNGAWAILNLNNERLLLGTCAQSGYLHSLDLQSRTWAKPLRMDKETYIWNLTLGSDGKVYGGTYDGCIVVQYDPEAHTLRNAGRASDNPLNLYSRTVDGSVPGYIVVTGGMNTHFAAAYHIESGTFRPIATYDSYVTVTPSTNGNILIARGDEVLEYDPETFELIGTSALEDKVPMSFARRLSDGTIAAVRGQDYYIQASGDTGDANRELIRIPTPAPATHIHTIVSDSEGAIWGACGFGQTIFYYKPESKEIWNSPVVCNGGGEVYGMAFKDGLLYMSAYAGGDHIVYDPSDTWDQLSNRNPKTLESVAPALIRPTGRTVVGPDGCLWSGWSAKYGVYGGGLSRIDPATNEVSCWYDPVPEQQIGGLTADSQYLYFVTNGGSSGLGDKEDTFFFAVWSTEGEIVYKKQFELGEKLSSVLAQGGFVFVRVNDTIHVFAPEKMSFIDVIYIRADCSCLLAADERTIAAFCGDQLHFIDTGTRQPRFMTTLPGSVGTAAVTPGGDIYFAHGIDLYKLEIV